MVEIDGQPWFVASDVYRILFGKTTGISVRDYIKPDETMVVKKVSASGALSSLFVGSCHTLAFITESGLYKLVMRSDKPAARKFQDWVTRSRLATLDVLPAIRKAEA